MWLRCPPTPVGPSQSEPPFGVPKISETFTAVLHCNLQLINSISHLKICSGTPTVISTAKLGTSLIPGPTSIHQENCKISHCNANTKSHFKRKRCYDVIGVVWFVSSLIIVTTLSNSNCFTTALDCWNNLSLRRFFQPRTLNFWGLALLSGTLDFWSLWTFSSWTPGSFWTQLGPLRHWERFNTKLLNMFCFGWQVVQRTGR